MADGTRRADSAVTPANSIEWQISERGGGSRGGELAVALTAEPRTYLPLLAFDAPSKTVIYRLHASLVRRDGQTFEIQPALARSWSISPDHKVVNLELRRGVRFSDGEAFDADDVLFSIRAAQDPKVGSPHASVFVIDGEPVQVDKVDSHHVRLTFPVPQPAPLTLLNDFAILPEHLLAAEQAEGRLRESWGLGTEPAAMAGLGPFRLLRHEPGRRLVLERNPHYWRRDAEAPEGTQLPYLDRLVFDVVADDSAKLVRFLAGSIHLISRLPGDRFDDLGERARKQSGPPITLRDLGPGLGSSFLIFNLNDVDLPDVEARQRWFRQSAFRRAVSLAVDRRSVANIVYHGHATPVVGDLTPGNTLYWSSEQSAAGRSMERANLEAARALLQDAGFRTDKDGFWLDQQGERIRLTLVTNTSNSNRVAIATHLEEDFRRLGLEVSFVGLEFGALVERLTQTFDYDLLLLEFSAGLDPNSTLPLWLTDGPNHLFRLKSDGEPFPWEAEIDRLMRDQKIEIDPAERKRQVLAVQDLVATQAPLVFLVSPNVLVGAHGDLGNFAPSIIDHPTLWNCDELYWSAQAADGAEVAAGAR